MPEPVAASPLPSIDVLCNAAREAGDIALRYFRQDPRTWTKPGDSPVTEADLAIDAMLHTRLRGAYPFYGWLSEEIEDDGSRHTDAPTFIVDPIDGTRGFIAGTDDWAVSIALVHQGAPVLGVLFNPVQDRMLFAQAGHGAHVQTGQGEERALAPSGKADLSNALIAFPGPARSTQTYRKAPRLASLALRIAGVADGSLDGCVASANAKHWDIAAADILVREAGLTLLHGDGATPRYDGPTISHPWLVCGTPALCGALRGWKGSQIS